MPDLKKDKRVLKAAGNAIVLAANQRKHGVIVVRLDNGSVITLQPEEQLVRQAQLTTPPTGGTVINPDDGIDDNEAKAAAKALAARKTPKPK